MDDFLTKRRERSNSVADIDLIKNAEVFQKSRKTVRSPTRKRKDREVDIDMEEIAKMLKNLTMDISEMKIEMKNGNEDLKKKMEENNLQMKLMIEETRKEIAEIKMKEKVWEEERQALRQELKTRELEYKKEIERSQALENRIISLENIKEKEEKEKRRNNIIIKGKDFNEKFLKTEVKDFVKRYLDVDIEIREVFKNKNGKCVNVKLDTWEQKVHILKAKTKLKQIDERIYIDNDLTIGERDVQREIRKIAEEERKKGNDTKIGYQKLRINNKWYQWDGERSKLNEQEMKSLSKN